jgi:hypothetical protein
MHAIVTLIERDFLYGAAALYNSLVRNGFDGTLIIGYRGDDGLPAELLKRMKNLPNGLPIIRWIKLSTPWHFTNYKAQFLLDILEVDPSVNKISYVDPDIVVTCPWDWFDKWCEVGPVLCGDSFDQMPSYHPTRNQWRDLLADHKMQVYQEPSIYFNAGFLSVMRNHKSFIKTWHDIIEHIASQYIDLNAIGNIEAWRTSGRWNPFYAGDQDAFNMTVMSWNGPLATFGSDAMAFTHGWNILPHAIGANKPWRKSYIWDSLQGIRPRYVEKMFWECASTPIPLVSPSDLKKKRLSIKIASLIGRFYGRS